MTQHNQPLCSIIISHGNPKGSTCSSSLPSHLPSQASFWRPRFGGCTPPEPVYDVCDTPSYFEDPPRYDFNYAVKDYSNNDFGHQENRDGYNTNGGYSVLLPDGRLQRVTYTVNGDEGYIAEVTYEGEAQYPDHQPAPYHPTPAPYRPTPAPYHPTPAPYH
ncbi:uncharacterized protein LOC143036230 [Oratosquilla oratoria]|uniref:uncharacterized protein LOC143036230 n=1 Tax=Oratosquilla oratoria TaxID=337810 RepID=UPI003F7692DC